LADRSSAARRVENRTAPDRVAVIVALRRLRMTAAEIAETLLMPRSGRRRLHRGRKRQQFTRCRGLAKSGWGYPQIAWQPLR
jgi:hypothetical protein